MKITLRTPKTEKIYEDYRKKIKLSECPLCKEAPKEEYEHWYLTPNRFPYDRIAEIHDMLILKRHAKDMTIQELAELTRIKDQLNNTYDSIIENLPTEMTIPAHFHVHLIRYIRQ